MRVYDGNYTPAALLRRMCLQVDQLAAKSIKEVLSEPEGERLRQSEFVHVDAEAPLSHASGE